MTSTNINTQKTYLYLLYNEIYYDDYCKEYFNILTLNKAPEGELKKYIKLTSITSPSTKQNTLINKHCTYTISDNLLYANENISNTNSNSKICCNKSNNFLTLENINEFTEFLINNNYTIDNSITKIYKINNICSNFSSNNSKKILYSFKIIL